MDTIVITFPKVNVNTEIKDSGFRSSEALVL